MMNEPTKPHTHTHIPNTRSPSPLKNNSHQTNNKTRQAGPLILVQKRPVQMTVISLHFNSLKFHFGASVSVRRRLLPTVRLDAVLEDPGVRLHLLQRYPLLGVQDE